MQSFIISLLLILVATFTFPEYFTLNYLFVIAYGIFKPNQPIFTNLAFWISFAISDSSAIVKATDVCNACEANSKKSKWDCIGAVEDLAANVIMNAFSVYIGWHISRTSREALKDVDTAVFKRRVSRGGDIWIVMFLVFLTVLPLMVLAIDMNYPIVDLLRWTLNYLTYN